MRVLLLVLIYFVLCPLAGHYLGLFMIQTALSGGPANLITMYIVRIVAMILVICDRRLTLEKPFCSASGTAVREG